MNAFPIIVLSWGFGWTKRGDDYLYQSKVDGCSRTGVAVSQDQLRQMVRTSCAPTEKLEEFSSIIRCGGSPSSRLRLDRDKAPSHDGGEVQCGTTVITQLRCHGNDETASVRRVMLQRCEWGKFEASSGSDRDKDSSHDAEAMAGTSECVHY